MPGTLQWPTSPMCFLWLFLPVSKACYYSKTPLPSLYLLTLASHLLTPHGLQNPVICWHETQIRNTPTECLNCLSVENQLLAVWYIPDCWNWCCWIGYLLAGWREIDIVLTTTIHHTGQPNTNNWIIYESHRPKQKKTKNTTGQPFPQVLRMAFRASTEEKFHNRTGWGNAYKDVPNVSSTRTPVQRTNFMTSTLVLAKEVDAIAFVVLARCFACILPLLLIIWPASNRVIPECNLHPALSSNLILIVCFCFSCLGWKPEAAKNPNFPLPFSRCTSYTCNCKPETPHLCSSCLACRSTDIQDEEKQWGLSLPQTYLTTTMELTRTRLFRASILDFSNS